MVPSSKALVSFLGLLLLGGGAWFLLQGEETAPEDYGFEAAPDPGSEPLEETLIGEERGSEDLLDEAGEDLEPLTQEELRKAVLSASKAELHLEGRVVDRNGRPLAKARVSVWSRKSFNWTRMRGGNPRGGWNNMEMRAFRNQQGPFKPTLLGGKLLTDSLGRFGLSEESFSESSLEVAVEFEDFAPKVVRRDWKVKEGKLVLEDIVLELGGKVLGSVTNERGAPIAEASVRFRPEGGRGRGFRRGGMGWGRSNRLLELLGEARTDKMGRFELRNLPSGPFRLDAEAPRHISGRSGRLRLKTGQTLQAGPIQLTVGAQLRGVVRNLEGKPVPDAEVVARLADSESRDRFRLIMESHGFDMGRGRMSRRDPALRGERRRLWEQFMGRGRRPVRTRTDKEGRYFLEKLPHSPLNLGVLHPNYIDEGRQGVDPDQIDTLDFALSRRFTLSGSILDASTGKPVEQFWVRARTIRLQELPEDLRKRFEGAADSTRNPRRNRRRGDGMRRPDFNRRGDPGRDGPRGNRRGNRGRNNENNRGSRNPGNRGANNRNPRRPTPAQQKAQQEREARRRAQELERARRRSRMDAERATRQSRRDQERRALFGSSGIPFRGDPKFTSHTMGEFRIPDLNPGLYVLDVAAPGYIKVANGPIRLVKGEKPPRLTVRIEKGRVIEGKVVDSNGAPLPNADVELLAPTGQTRPPFFSGSPLLRVMRPPNEGRRLESVRTDIQGFFSFHAQKAGSYRIRARAQRYATGLLDDLSLNTRSDLTGLVVKLVPAGRIYGKVHNLPKGERVSVAVASTKGLRRFVRVDSTSGEYSIDGLDPGDYFVRIQQGRNPMGQILASLTTPGADQPDLTLRPGASVRYDLNAAATLVGSLEGRIYLNSGPGANLEVRLAPEPTNPTANPGLQGMGGVRRVQRMLGQMLRRRTNGQGEFKIEGIPPGAYRIEIRRRGGRGRPERLLFKGPLRVNPGPATRRDFTLVLGGLDLEIVDVDKGRALPGGTVFMALASQARNLPPKEWRKLPSFQKIDFRKGRVKLREIQVGEWLYAVTGPGFQPRTGEIYIGAGDSTPPATFKLKARPKKKKPAKGKAKKKGP